MKGLGCILTPWGLLSEFSVGNWECVCVGKLRLCHENVQGSGKNSKFKYTPAPTKRKREMYLLPVLHFVKREAHVVGNSFPLRSCVRFRPINSHMGGA